MCEREGGERKGDEVRKEVRGWGERGREEEEVQKEMNSINLEKSRQR